jgi:hypothetical protein
MSGLFAYLAIGYLGWRLIRRARRKRAVRGARGFARPAQHVEHTPTTRAQARGEAGEVGVSAELRRVLTGLCGDDFHLHDGAVLLHHAPGTAFPTAEIDHLAVTPFGLFVIETKNWGGSITAGANRDELVCVSAAGSRETRRSPLAQNRTKVAFLLAKLPRVWTIEGLGVFAAPDCTLHPDLPPALIHISELAHCLRLRQHAFRISGQKPVNVSTAWKAIMLNASIAKNEIDSHRKRARESPKETANVAV